MSKHEDIIKYILSLDVGSKISVRGISSDLNVSEGTAYRAIKECETIGIVNTIDRVGTVRVEKVEKKHIQVLTYGEIVNIVDGTIVGGKTGINGNLTKFIIGAMTLETVLKYITPGCLVIVGNREEVQELALENESAVLITGGFECSDRIKLLADEKGLPVISSSYDTFTVASMINKAIYESLIKKDIILVEDVMENRPSYLTLTDTVADLKKLLKETNHDRYPVVDENMKVMGMVTLKDVHKTNSDDEFISKIMSKEPIVVTMQTTVAYAAHIMAWEGIKLCPVVNKKRLVGVISREDVIKAMQFALRQPQAGETIEDLILKNFEYESSLNQMHFWGEIIPQMLDSVGTASWSSMNMLLSTAGIMTLRQNNNFNISVDSMSIYFMKPVQMGTIIDIHTTVIDKGRSSSKVEISMYNRNKDVLAKAILSAKILNK